MENIVLIVTIILFAIWLIYYTRVAKNNNKYSIAIKWKRDAIPDESYDIQEWNANSSLLQTHRGNEVAAIVLKHTQSVTITDKNNQEVIFAYQSKTK